MHHRHDNEPYSYCPQKYVDQDGPTGVTAGAWREGITENGAMQPINNITSNNHSKSAKEIRNLFMEYCNSDEGAVHWQLDMVDVHQITMIDYEPTNVSMNMFILNVDV